MPATGRKALASLGTLKALDRDLAGRAMHPLIGNLACPVVKMRLKGRPTVKTATSNRVLFDIANAALVFAFGPGPIGGASLRPEPPVPGKGMQPSIELDLTRFTVVPDHQSAVVVKQHLFGDAAKMPEGTLQPGKPALLALVAERPDIEPARVAKGGNKQVDLYGVAADRYPALAKINLQLLARRRLKTQRRPGLRFKLASQRGDRALDCPQAQRDALLGNQLLTHDIGIASMAAKPLGYPILKVSQFARPTTTIS